MNKINSFKRNKIDDYNVGMTLSICLCFDFILFGVGLYLHYTGKLNLYRFWGILPLIVSIPCLIKSGFNLVYIFITMVGCVWLAYTNINDIALASLISFVVVGVVGLIAVFVKKNK